MKLHLLLLMLLAATLLIGCGSTRTAGFVEPPIEPVSSACVSPRVSRAATANTVTDAEQSVERIVVSADPESASSLASRAWDRSRADDRNETVRLLELALTRADNNMPVDRIHWTYGWAMFNLNEHRCALAHFEQARRLAPDQISWVPHTFAVTYWQMGEPDLAINWYDVAAKNTPGCWIDAKAAARCTRRWLRQEQRAMGLLITAWKQRKLQ